MHRKVSSTHTYTHTFSRCLLQLVGVRWEVWVDGFAASVTFKLNCWSGHNFILLSSSGQWEGNVCILLYTRIMYAMSGTRVRVCMCVSAVLVLRLLRVVHTYTDYGVGNLCDALLDRVYAFYPLNIVCGRRVYMHGAHPYVMYKHIYIMCSHISVHILYGH